MTTYTQNPQITHGRKQGHSFLSSPKIVQFVSIFSISILFFGIWCFFITQTASAEENEDPTETIVTPEEVEEGSPVEGGTGSTEGLNGGNNGLNGGNNGLTGGNSGSPSSGAGSRGLTNPLKFDSLTGFLLAIVDIILILAVPIIILFIIYAGFLFVTAQGNESQLETAKSALLWAVVGGVIVLGARVILKIVEGTVDAFKV